MPSIQEPVSAGADDIFSNMGISNDEPYSLNVNAVHADIGARQNNAPGWRTNQFGGIIFRNIDVPNAATIDTATITSRIAGATASPENIKWYGVATDNAQNWATTTFWYLPDTYGVVPRNRPRTTAFVAKEDGADEEVTVEDVTAIVQEIVDRAGWVTGNDLQMILVPGPQLTTGASYLRVAAYDRFPVGTLQAVLDVTYTEGGGEEPAGAHRSGRLSLGTGLGL